jgi:hypothetical protein
MRIAALRQRERQQFPCPYSFYKQGYQLNVDIFSRSGAVRTANSTYEAPTGTSMATAAAIVFAIGV